MFFKTRLLHNDGMRHARSVGSLAVESVCYNRDKASRPAESVCSRTTCGEHRRQVSAGNAKAPRGAAHIAAAASAVCALAGIRFSLEGTRQGRHGRLLPAAVPVKYTELCSRVEPPCRAAACGSILQPCVQPFFYSFGDVG